MWQLTTDWLGAAVRAVLRIVECDACHAELGSNEACPACADFNQLVQEW